MSFVFKEEMLAKLCKVNSFEITGSEMVFFGFRGCIPLDADNHEFRDAHELILLDTNNVNPRCTISQWLPQDGVFAVFPGSTVPYIRQIKKSLEKSGRGANQLMTGYYTDYRKGRHKASSITGHDAFRQMAIHPIRRTADDTDFDEDDRVEYTNPGDNIHSAWTMSVNSDYFASAGCQVIVGYPKCGKPGYNEDRGPWSVFRNNAYSREQERFPYILLNGTDAMRAASTTYQWKSRLRFGSKGPLVEKVQTALKEKGYYEGIIDSDFGKRTSRAIMAFQEEAFGPNADDGIVGPMTASVLGVEWPEAD